MHMHFFLYSSSPREREGTKYTTTTNGEAHLFVSKSKVVGVREVGSDLSLSTFTEIPKDTSHVHTPPLQIEKEPCQRGYLCN